ncbi:hypothetical protein AtNW77_Chr5g0113321 [Arabidopsis thaliana]
MRFADEKGSYLHNYRPSDYLTISMSMADNSSGQSLSHCKPPTSSPSSPSTTVSSPKSPFPVTSREECKEVEREGDDYSVYCKRGRREAREVVSSWAPMIMLDEQTKKC